MSSLTFFEESESVRVSRLQRRKKHSKENSVAVVIASRRAEDLEDLCDDLFKQTLPKFSIYIGLHGYQPDAMLKGKLDRLKRRNIKVKVERFDTDATLGKILSTLCEVSSERFVAKMDDDDIYGPEHLHDLLDVLIENKCDVAGKAMNYIYLDSINLTVRRATGVGVSQYELFDDWVCGGTIMVSRSAGEKAGWFGSGVTAVDTHLLQGVKTNGGKIWRTYGAGYVYRRRENNHTYSTNHAKYLNAASEEWVGLVRGAEFGVR